MFTSYILHPKVFLKKLKNKIALKKLIRILAFNLDKFSLRFIDDNYQEREEKGAVNIEVKIKRKVSGGPFESPIPILVNKAAIQLLKKK